MRPSLALLGVSVLAIMTTACSSGSGASSNPASADLKGTNWSVTTVGGATTIADTPPTMAFGTDGTVTGTTGCNSYNGGYTLNGGAITIGPLATTRKACEAALSAQEAAFTGALQSAAAWSIGSDGRLTLKGPAQPDDKNTIVAAPIGS